MSETSGVKMMHIEKTLPNMFQALLFYAGHDLKITPLEVKKGEEAVERYIKYYTKIIENPEEPPEPLHVGWGEGPRLHKLHPQESPTRRLLVRRGPNCLHHSRPDEGKFQIFQEKTLKPVCFSSMHTTWKYKMPSGKKLRRISRPA